jgi:hypothetical protein
MENLDDNVDISRAWETTRIKDNIKTSASSINYGLTKNTQTYQIKRARLNRSGYKITA